MAPKIYWVAYEFMNGYVRTMCVRLLQYAALQNGCVLLSTSQQPQDSCTFDAVQVLRLHPSNITS